MDLAFVEDYTSTVNLDADLLSVPTSGLYLNSGTHPNITINNLLQFLPKVEFQLGQWAVGVTYGNYSSTRSRNDLVTDLVYVYESIQSGNVGNALNDTAYWRKTNWSSIHLRNFIQRVKDRVLSDLHLVRRLVENQYLYENGLQVITLSNDYHAWKFEPKGSDYVNFRINEISLQAMTTNPVDLYVVNQGVLIDTLTLNPNDGILSFEQLNYSFSGKGAFYFAIDGGVDVKVSGNQIDPLAYTGFTVSTAVGTGATPEGATWSDSTTGNGLGFNISAYADSSVYITNNLIDFASFIRSTFEMVSFEMFRSNSNSKANLEQRNITDERLVLFETTDLTANTVAKRYYDEKKRAFRSLEKTFDTQIRDTDSDELQVSVSSL